MVKKSELRANGRILVKAPTNGGKTHAACEWFKEKVEKGATNNLTYIDILERSSNEELLRLPQSVLDPIDLKQPGGFGEVKKEVKKLENIFEMHREGLIADEKVPKGVVFDAFHHIVLMSRIWLRQKHIQKGVDSDGNKIKDKDTYEITGWDYGTCNREVETLLTRVTTLPVDLMVLMDPNNKHVKKYLQIEGWFEVVVNLRSLKSGKHEFAIEKVRGHPTFEKIGNWERLDFSTGISLMSRINRILKRRGVEIKD